MQVEGAEGAAVASKIINPDAVSSMILIHLIQSPNLIPYMAFDAHTARHLSASSLIPHLFSDPQPSQARELHLT